MEIRNENQITGDDIISMMGITKKLIIGPSVNSNEIVLRIMYLEPKCSIMYHSHPFPHIWKIEKGKGIFIDKNKDEIVVNPGDFIFINSNEPHCLKNNSDELLEWLCFGTIISETTKPKSLKDMNNISRKDFFKKTCFSGICLCGFSSIGLSLNNSRNSGLTEEPQNNNTEVQQAWISVLLTNLNRELDEEKKRGC